MFDKRDIFCVCDFETTGLNPKDHYPIEVGCVFINSEFEMKHQFSSLIYWDPIYTKLKKKQVDKDVEYEWPDEYKDAYNVHKIEAIDWLRGAKHSYVIGAELSSICKDLKEKSGGKRKPIIISDNAFFEHTYMLKIYELNGMDFPFHYCTWDINLLEKCFDLGKSEQKKHRALDDALGEFEKLKQIKKLL